MFQWCWFVLLPVLVVVLCSITCFSDDILFYYMFQWWCFVLLHVSVVVFCSIKCFSGDVLFYYMFQWCWFVLLPVLVVVLCSITCFSCDVLFYYMFQCSCGTVALYGPLYIFFLRTIGLRFSLYKKLSKLRKKNLAPLFCQFLSWNRVRERSSIYFVSLDIYLHSSILTYLLIFISSSLS
jgi:hypothetical protein